MLNITYIFQDIEPNNTTKLLLSRVCNLVNETVSLPKNIEIEFRQLDKSNYAETSLNPRFSNRITINSDLHFSEMIIPLIHELIHLNQIYTGQLSKRRDGVYIWEGKQYNLSKKMSYNEYLNLPWENDVLIRQETLRVTILEKLGKI